MTKNRRNARIEREANQLIRERSRKQQAKTRAKLNAILSFVEDEAFVQLVWAVDAIQSSREPAARGLIQYPREAVTTELTSRLHVHKWELETLLNEALAVPKRPLPPGPNRVLNCYQFSAMAALANMLRRLENAESGLVLRRTSMFVELHRLSQRQFEWQRGFLNAAQFYRWAYIFGGPICDDFLVQRHGLNVPDFMLAGFALFSGLANGPTLLRNTDFSGVGVKAATRDAALQLMTITHADARRQAALMRLQGRGVAYEASVLRQKPIIAFDERLRAPLPALIIPRTTSGIFYDLVDGPAEARNEIGHRFEDYSAELLASLHGAKIQKSFTYRLGTNTVESPDLMLRYPGGTSFPIECKARRMTIHARFGEDPIAEATAGYDEIAKGVFQLWRFFSHGRRGLHTEPISNSSACLVLTLDSWLSLAGTLRDEVIQRAKAMAARDSEIIAEDCKPVVFCSIEDLELALGEADAITFMQAISAAATDPTYKGWALPNVLEKVASHTVENSYPLLERMGDVLPWWDGLYERAKARSQTGSGELQGN